MSDQAHPESLKIEISGRTAILCIMGVVAGLMGNFNVLIADLLHWIKDLIRLF